MGDFVYNHPLNLSDSPPGPWDSLLQPWGSPPREGGGGGRRKGYLEPFALTVDGQPMWSVKPGVAKGAVPWCNGVKMLGGDPAAWAGAAGGHFYIVLRAWIGDENSDEPSASAPESMEPDDATRWKVTIEAVANLSDATSTEDMLVVPLGEVNGEAVTPWNSQNLDFSLFGGAWVVGGYG